MNRSRGHRACLAIVLALQLLVAAPLQAASPGLGGGEPLNLSLARIVSALIVCLFIAGAAILVIRQRGGTVRLPSLLGRIDLRSRQIEVVETRRLSQHADICLVRHGGREYLLLLMAGRSRLLSGGSQAQGDEAKDPLACG